MTFKELPQKDKEAIIDRFKILMPLSGTAWDAITHALIKTNPEVNKDLAIPDPGKIAAISNSIYQFFKHHSK